MAMKTATTGTGNDSTKPQLGGQGGATNQVPSQVLEPLIEQSVTNEQEEMLQALKSQKTNTTKKGEAVATSRKEP